MENIKEVFKEIIGKAIYQIIKAAHSLNIQFGEAINCDDGIVGQYIFHIECPWRIKKGSVLLGWGDGNIPRSGLAYNEFENDRNGNTLLDEKVMDFERNEQEGWVVKNIEISNLNDLIITFENEAVFETFCNDSENFDQWELVKSQDKEIYRIDTK